MYTQEWVQGESWGHLRILPTVAEVSCDRIIMMSRISGRFFHHVSHQGSPCQREVNPKYRTVQLGRGNTDQSSELLSLLEFTEQGIRKEKEEKK